MVALVFADPGVRKREPGLRRLKRCVCLAMSGLYPMQERQSSAVSAGPVLFLTGAALAIFWLFFQPRPFRDRRRRAHGPAAPLSHYWHFDPGASPTLSAALAA